MSYINKVRISNDTHLIEPTLHAVAAGTASAYTASISSFELIEGVVVTIKLTTDCAANATLNVTNKGAKAIRYEGVAISGGMLKANRTYSFVYTITNNVGYWDVIGNLSGDDRIEIEDWTART